MMGVYGMNKSPLLSIIVPVYNTEKYVSRCLETIINQSICDYEIIIINDASTDNSDKIIRNRISGLKNVKYYALKKNIGVGNARNVGIKNSSGQYIGFIDSDDWIDSSYYEIMVQSIINNNADICISGIKTEIDDIYFPKYRYEYPFNTLIDGEFGLHSLTDMYNHDIRISPIVNNKIYRKSLIKDNKLQFDKSRRSQDNYFTFMVLVYAEKISLVNNTFYHYYQRTGSATHDFSKSYIDDYVFILDSLKKTLIQRNIFSDYEKEYISYTNRCITALINNLFSREQDERIQKEYLLYILNEIAKILPINALIENMDIERFKRFWEI